MVVLSMPHRMRGRSVSLLRMVWTLIQLRVGRRCLIVIGGGLAAKPLVRVEARGAIQMVFRFWVNWVHVGFVNRGSLFWFRWAKKVITGSMILPSSQLNWGLQIQPPIFIRTSGEMTLRGFAGDSGIVCKGGCCRSKGKWEVA